MIKKHEELKIEKALNQFVTTMNGQTFTNNGDYARTLKLVAKEYFEHCFKLGYVKGGEDTCKEYVAYIIDGEKVRY